MPTAETAARWAGEARPGFRFALKFPSSITHDAMLVGCERLLDEWIDRLRPLAAAGVLGPSLLQLPPFFTGLQLSDLASLLRRWPAELPLAVEPRHDDYFAAGSVERDFDALLRDTGHDRALFDSRALFQSPPDDPIEQVSQGRKPNPKRRDTVTGRTPFLRFVGRNRLELAAPWIDEWADTVAGWIGRGLEPHVYCHAPDDTLAPAFAERFHAALRRRAPGLGELAEWPGRGLPKQRSLF
jgi:uncharacterized protein YecE (DUF72 family)